MATPIAIFPGAIVTDEQLKVANNRIQTTLRAPIDASSTILPVQSTAGFVPHAMASIGSEIVAIESVENIPSPRLIVSDGGRGFDGTTAAAHATGARVSMLINAWHHNAAAAEIKAIEEALGPNLSNIGQSRWIFSADFIWSRTPGGTLNPGSNVIRLSGVPRGINGTNADHWVYISGGSGEPEAVLIAGGTAASGAGSGTIIINCDHEHSGAWTVSSATAGISEAIAFCNGPGLVLVPKGNWQARATITVPTGISIMGAGQGATKLTLMPTGACIPPAIPLFRCMGDHIKIQDMYLFQQGTSVAKGSVGIFTAGNGSGIPGAICNFAFFTQLLIDGFYNGLYLMGGGGSIDLTAVNVQFFHS
ncbi:MAG TPA: hypothetical protein VKD72_00415, partial [Gemmataceae bacterium]|nr:hypothetical protein [Gemmataceae bacterium]